jgi:hypothetical protein
MTSATNGPHAVVEGEGHGRLPSLRSIRVVLPGVRLVLHGWDLTFDELERHARTLERLKLDTNLFRSMEAARLCRPVASASSTAMSMALGGLRRRPPTAERALDPSLLHRRIRALSANRPIRPFRSIYVHAG